MRKTLSVFGLTLIVLAMIDAGVAAALGWAEARGRLGTLVQYFEYGRSVPGKLARWEARPSLPGNLYDVAWRSNVIAESKTVFLDEGGNAGPIVRGYGMSFVNNVLRAARETRAGLHLDLHSGPGAPPNFTYALFEEDRENRRSGDVAVFGILSSAIPAMAALSNRTWAFEQPAPFTYPVFWPEGDGLRRIEPLINNAAAERASQNNPADARAWSGQIASEDAFHSSITFGASWADRSPLVRLVRRSLAKSHIERTDEQILGGAYPVEDVLRRMIVNFAEKAKREGQIPVVMLIQSRSPNDVDILAIAKPVLEQQGIPYLATVEHADPREPSNFVSDGHYKPAIDRVFGQAFVELLDELAPGSFRPR